MNEHNRLTLAALLRRAKLQRHCMKRHYIFRVYWALERFLHIPSVLEATARGIGWESGKLMLTKYTWDSAEWPESKLGGRHFAGPVRAVQIMSEQETLEVAKHEKSATLAGQLKGLHKMMAPATKSTVGSAVLKPPVRKRGRPRKIMGDLAAKPTLQQHTLGFSFKGIRPFPEPNVQDGLGPKDGKRGA
jgi:hypothetical protein